MKKSLKCDTVVLGAGPGGYTAAFRAADLGQEVVIVEKHDRIGGVCLNVGCIPSKTLLHASQIIEEAALAQSYGLNFGKPKINLPTLRKKKEDVITQLTGGLGSLAKARKVKIVTGKAKFTDQGTLLAEGGSDSTEISFKNAIIASGSHPVHPGFLPNIPKRIWDSTSALTLSFVPKHLVVLGGGIIGLEMAQVYGSLGSEITIVEMLQQIIPGADSDLVTPLLKKIQASGYRVLTSTRLLSVEAKNDSLSIEVQGEKQETLAADALLVAVGRRPNTTDIGLEEIGVKLDDAGFIQVNSMQQTNLPNIYAVGDVAGNPMLAHKAIHEGKVAAEVISGKKSSFDPMAIPSVAYTEPEIAWTGYTETQARAEGVPYTKGSFPWSGSGRALASDQAQGKSKILFHKETGRIIGAGIVGGRAGDLIAEATLAIEMGADAEDMGSTIHAHPTFSETLAFSAEIVHGSITDAMPARKKS